MYTVKNIYGIRGDTHHATPEAALKTRDIREGEGWIVTDDDGKKWDWYTENDGTKRAVREW